MKQKTDAGKTDKGKMERETDGYETENSIKWETEKGNEHGEGRQRNK